MKTNLLLLALTLVILSCQPKPNSQINKSIEKEGCCTIEAESDAFYQYSIWFAFVNKVFNGDLKVKDLKKQGDIGLGSFDYLDGEMVMLDGVVYRIRENGEITEGQAEDEIVYADAAFFSKDDEFRINESVDFPTFQKQVNEKLKSPHFFYAFKAYGRFKRIKLGGVPKWNVHLMMV